MFTQPQIAPSILSADCMNMSADLVEIEQGGAGYVHVDVMDGHFVPNLTLGVPFCKQIRTATGLPFDVHLMISNPLEQLPWFLATKPDIVTVHMEALDPELDQVNQAIDMIHEAGVKAAIALKPDTDTATLAPYIHKLDMVLIMSVYPGFSGQSYIPGSHERVAQVVEMSRAAGVAPLIQVDGGLGENQATFDVVSAGADVLVAGSAVFGKQDRAAAISAMLQVAHDAQAKTAAGLGPSAQVGNVDGERAHS